MSVEKEERSRHPDDFGQGRDCTKRRGHDREKRMGGGGGIRPSVVWQGPSYIAVKSRIREGKKKMKVDGKTGGEKKRVT